MCLKRTHFNPAHISANLTKLELDFIAKGGKWKEFTIGNLFESENGDFDIQKTHLNNKGYLVVSSGIENCGIIGKTDIEAKIFPRHTLTCDMFGNVFYREFDYKMVTHARVFSLKFLDENFNNKSALYVATTMNYLKSKFSYSNMCSFKKIQDMSILLPTQEGKIAFDFMEKYIKELEAERIKELGAYLSITGLKDYKLNAKEEQALQNFIKLSDTDGGGGLTYKEIRIGDLFNYTRGTRLVKSKRIKGNLPLLTAGEFNQGVKEFISNTNQQIFSNAITIDMFCNSFVHIENFCCDDNILVLNAKIPTNKYHLLFISTIINKDKSKYGYGKQYRIGSLENHTILLPTQNNKIAFDFMESFISAVQKEIIKSVVFWSQKRINATKMLVE